MYHLIADGKEIATATLGMGIKNQTRNLIKSGGFKSVKLTHDNEEINGLLERSGQFSFSKDESED